MNLYFNNEVVLLVLACILLNIDWTTSLNEPYDPLANSRTITRYKLKNGQNPFANFSIPNRKQYYLRKNLNKLEVINRQNEVDQRLAENEVAFTESLLHRTSHRNLVILGSPDWYNVNENQYPYRTVGLFSYVEDGYGYYCTATLIRKDMIITAGHCSGSFDQTWIKSIKFYPAYRTSDYSYAGKISTAIRARRNNQFDALLILLQKATTNSFVGETVGWMGRRYLLRTSFVEQPISACMVGYGTKGGCPSSTFKCKAMKRCCSIAAYRGNFAVTQCDTSHGDSGSSYYTNTSGNPYVVVIHSGGICATGFLHDDESTETCDGDYNYVLKRYNVGGAIGDLRSASFFTGRFS
jgi:V8-like Glu-specific endopeptidase